MKATRFTAMFATRPMDADAPLLAASRRFRSSLWRSKENLFRIIETKKEKKKTQKKETPRQKKYKEQAVFQMVFMYVPTGHFNLVL